MSGKIIFTLSTWIQVYSFQIGSGYTLPSKHNVVWHSLPMTPPFWMEPMEKKPVGRGRITLLLDPSQVRSDAGNVRPNQAVSEPQAACDWWHLVNMTSRWVIECNHRCSHRGLLMNLKIPRVLLLKTCLPNTHRSIDLGNDHSCSVT